MDALDDVRKEEQRTADSKKELFRGRRLFMVPKARMSSEQAAKLESLSKRYPKTGKAYSIVATLDDFYACQTAEEAEHAFDRLYMDASLPFDADEGCRQDTPEPQGEDPGLLLPPHNECCLR